jgi:hypothetical protein
MNQPNNRHRVEYEICSIIHTRLVTKDFVKSIHQINGHDVIFDASGLFVVDGFLETRDSLEVVKYINERNLSREN